MKKPIDQLGFGPKRAVVEDGEGGYILMVTPSQLIGKRPTVHVPLTADQYERYKAWTQGMLMQHALPELSPATREMLMTGLTDEAFKEIFKDDEADL